MSAVPKPFWTNTFASVINTITSAIRPKSSGSRSRAKTMDVTNCTPFVPQRSMNFQNRDVTMVLVVNMGVMFNVYIKRPAGTRGNRKMGEKARKNQVFLQGAICCYDKAVAGEWFSLRDLIGRRMLCDFCA